MEGFKKKLPNILVRSISGPGFPKVHQWKHTGPVRGQSTCWCCAGTDLQSAGSNPLLLLPPPYQLTALHMNLVIGSDLNIWITRSRSTEKFTAIRFSEESLKDISWREKNCVNRNSNKDITKNTIYFYIKFEISNKKLAKCKKYIPSKNSIPQIEEKNIFL